MLSLHLPTRRNFSFKTWGVWSAVCLIFAFTSVPFLITLQGDLLHENMGDELPFSVEVLMTINAGIDGIICVVLGGLGLWMASRIGLGLPFIENEIDKTPIWNKASMFAALGIAVGLLATALIILLDAVVFSQPLTNILEPPGVDVTRPALWKGILAAFSAGVVEETLYRLFGLTFLMWIGLRLTRNNSGRPSFLLFAIANVIVAVGFGLSHISNLALFNVEPTLAIVVRLLVLNGVIAMIFGWLYWRFGLETAVIAHIVTDIILQGVGTLAGNATSDSGALIVYVIAHVILLEVAGLLWFMSTGRSVWKPFTKVTE